MNKQLEIGNNYGEIFGFHSVIFLGGNKWEMTYQDGEIEVRRIPAATEQAIAYLNK